jgi:hypothetical protein
MRALRRRHAAALALLVTVSIGRTADADSVVEVPAVAIETPPGTPATASAFVYDAADPSVGLTRLEISDDVAHWFTFHDPLLAACSSQRACDLDGTLDRETWFAVGVRCSPDRPSRRAARLTATSTAESGEPWADLECRGGWLYMGPQQPRMTGTGSSFTVEEPEGGILELGDVPAGQTTPAGTVRLRSDGTEPLGIAAVRACASTTIVDGMRPPFELAPGEAASWSVTCTPALPGVHAGCLEVESNHSAPVVTIGVRCRGLGGILRIGVEGVDLGDVLVGSSATVALPVENDCRRSTAPVTIRGLTTTSARFAATVRDRALPVTVEPCQSVLVDVTFTPADGRRERSTLIIESDGVDPVTRAWLGGDGATSGPDLQPSALDFGEVAVGASSTSLFELSNPTTQPATIEAITIDPPGAFHVTGPAPGDVLGPRWAMNLAMEAAPVAPGHHAATATVTFDVLPDVSTQVSAIGVAPGLGVITWDETPATGCSISARVCCPAAVRPGG